MPWVKLDDGYAEHPKVLAAGDAAAWLNVCALCWCNRRQTDGRIPVAVVPRLTALTEPLTLAERLVEVGLWERLEGGYLIHDYGHYQGTREQREANRQAWRESKANRRLSAKSASSATCPPLDTPECPGGGGIGGSLLPGICTDPDPESGSLSDGESTTRARTRPKNSVTGDYKSADAHARQVLVALSAARQRVIPGARALGASTGNLAGIRARLAEGASVEDCLHVIAVWEAEVGQRPKQGQYFNAVSPWRPENFAKRVGLAPGQILAAAPAEDEHGDDDAPPQPPPVADVLGAQEASRLRRNGEPERADAILKSIIDAQRSR